MRSFGLLLLTRLTPSQRRAILDDARPFLRSAAGWLDGERVIATGLAGGVRLASGTPPFDHVHAHSILRGTLEPPVQEGLRRTLAPGAVFYDIGANVGFFSLLAAAIVGPTGRVIAFEPVIESAAAIRACAAINQFGSIDVHQSAVGAENDLVDLCVVDDAAWSHLIARGRHPATRRIDRVAMVRIDDLIESSDLPPPAVIKIDVEGAELDVLAGMTETLTVHRPTVICELHATNREFAAIMASHGYSTENLDDTTDIVDAGPNVHVLARPLAS